MRWWDEVTDVIDAMWYCFKGLHLIWFVTNSHRIFYQQTRPSKNLFYKHKWGKIWRLFYVKYYYCTGWYDIVVFAFIQKCHSKAQLLLNLIGQSVSLVYKDELPSLCVCFLQTFAAKQEYKYLLLPACSKISILEKRLWTLALRFRKWTLN